MKIIDILSDDVLENNSNGSFIGALFNARNEAHRLHLDTESYAQHIALKEFYDSIIDLADTFAESIKGKYGKFTIDYTTQFTSDSAIDFITQFTNWLDNDITIPEDSYLLNIVDEIRTLAYSTKYKIENLK